MVSAVYSTGTWSYRYSLSSRGITNLCRTSVAMLGPRRAITVSAVLYSVQYKYRPLGDNAPYCTLLAASTGPLQYSPHSVACSALYY
jgi:hypothetical protein